MPDIVPDHAGAGRTRAGNYKQNGTGRGSRRAPPPRPLLAGAGALAAFGPAQGELAAHRGSLSTGRTVPLPVALLHPVAGPRRVAAPGCAPVARPHLLGLAQSTGTPVTIGQ